LPGGSRGLGDVYKRQGTHKAQLAASLQAADEVFLYQPPGLGWDLADVVAQLGAKGRLLHDIDELAAIASQQAQAGDHILVMSNGGFGGIHDKLLAKLST
jgi:UDP-N-acetylmuramate: L-alanyl-gamma-D-glutamyl-meso-diaminopimelate ligase